MSSAKKNDTAATASAKNDSAAASSAKKVKKVVTDEQKAQAKLNREQIIWSKAGVSISAAEHSRMITKNRGLVLSLLERGFTTSQVEEELAKRHPSPHHEPLTCLDFILNDFIYKTVNSNANSAKRSSEGKKKKADAGSGDDANNASAKDKADNDSSDDDVHAKKEDEQAKKKTKHEQTDAAAAKKTRGRASVTN